LRLIAIAHAFHKGELPNERYPVTDNFNQPDPPFFLKREAAQVYTIEEALQMLYSIKGEGVVRLTLNEYLVKIYVDNTYVYYHIVMSSSGAVRSIEEINPLNYK